MKTSSNILNKLYESENAGGMTIYDYIVNVCSGEIDMDVSDTEIDMMVALCYDVNDKYGDEYPEMTKFLTTLVKGTKVVKQLNGGYAPVLLCDFSSFFKPYNEQLKDFFDMDYSDFDEDEAYYEAVANLEPLISGNASESQYRELNEILAGKPVAKEEPKEEKKETNNNFDLPEGYDQEVYDAYFEYCNDIDLVDDEPLSFNDWYNTVYNKMNESVETEAGNDFDEVASYMYKDAGNDISNIPTIEDMDYIADVTKEEYEQLYKAVETAIGNVADHFYNGMIELSDRPTINYLNGVENDEDLDEAEQVFGELRDEAFKKFEEETKVGIWQDGRMGRHIVVEDDYYNARDYAKLCEIQEKYEQWVIDEFNKHFAKDMNESAKIISESTRPYDECPEDVKDAVYSFLDINFNADRLNDIKEVKYEEYGDNNEYLGNIYIDLDGKTYKIDMDGNILKDSVEDMNEAEEPKFLGAIRKIEYIKDLIKESPELFHDGINEDIVSLLNDLQDYLNKTNLKEADTIHLGFNNYKIAKFIEDSVEKLLTTDYTNCRYILDDKYAIFVGWSDGYDANDELAIHNEKHPTSCINVALLIRNDSDWTDMDYLNAPYYENGEVFDTSITIEPNKDFKYYEGLAGSMTDYYEQILSETEEGKLITESADKNLNKIADELVKTCWNEGKTHDVHTEVVGLLDNIKYDTGEFPELNFVREYNLTDEDYDKLYSLLCDRVNNLIKEDVAIDKDPDLDKEQVNADVDYWTEIDEANTEDVSDKEPLGVYTVSNNNSILIYEIEYDIHDRVLAGDSSNRDTAMWKDIIYDADETYFWYGDIKVPLDEVMRTNI